jgi:SAM-dependent methyltransferase
MTPDNAAGKRTAEQKDARVRAAAYYDANPVFPDDIPFYQARIPSPHARILELGCGTGRVLVSLIENCGYIHGVDFSEAMLARCLAKLREKNVAPGQARAGLGDITKLSLGMQFDFVIAPFRVLQTLETDEQVAGLFQSIARHLTPGGSAILNAFNPQYDPQGMLKNWVSDKEILIWETPYGCERLTCHARKLRFDVATQTAYPELVYRWHAGQEGDTLRDELVQPLAMRCYYPDEYLRLIEAHGFRVIARWGGYHGEPYGEGPELVAQFKMAAAGRNP